MKPFFVGRFVISSSTPLFNNELFRYLIYHILVCEDYASGDLLISSRLSILGVYNCSIMYMLLYTCCITVMICYLMILCISLLLVAMSGKLGNRNN